MILAFCPLFSYCVGLVITPSNFSPFWQTVVFIRRLVVCTARQTYHVLWARALISRVEMYWVMTCQLPVFALAYTVERGPW